MSFRPAMFSGSNVPSSLWESGVLRLPRPLSQAHRDFLIRNGWMAEYQPGRGAGTGGQSEIDAKEHVVNRFLNSAARMQFVCVDPIDEQPEVRDMVLDQMADGQIHLLDLAAGNGAGTLAMLALLSRLREESLVPKLPLNVSVHAVDYSPHALNYFAELLGDITPWFDAQGIRISLNLAVCDLTLSGEFSEVLEAFFDDAKASGVRRFLCVISALTGVGSEGMETIHDSLKIAAAGLSHTSRTSSWLWVEPHVGKAWPLRFADSVRLILQKVSHKFFRKGDGFEIKTSVPLLPTPPSRTFHWHDPHNDTNAQSHVTVMAFRSE